MTEPAIKHFSPGRPGALRPGVARGGGQGGRRLMAGRKDRTVRTLNSQPEENAYEIGYGRPPERARFRPGRSGNPRGRPKGRRNRRPAPHGERLREIILAEAYRTIPAGDGGERVTVTMAEAVVRSLAVNAARGDLRAQRLFTGLLLETERENRRAREALMEAAIVYKTEWERELDRCRRAGVKGPEPVPHPDDVVIDLASGEVRIRGAAMKQAKALGTKAT